MEFSAVIGVVFICTLASVAITWIMATKKITQLKEHNASIMATNDAILQAKKQHEELTHHLRKELDQLHEAITLAKEGLATEKQAKASLLEQLTRSRQELAAEQEKVMLLQKDTLAITAQHSALKAEQAERDNHHQKQLQQFEEQKGALKKEFENLANKIFEDKGKTFTQNSQASLDTLLKPFKEQIEGFQKRINDIHTESVKGNTNLEAELKKVLDVGLKMQAEANNLTTALKGDSQQRGAWGEAQLERTLQMGGLIQGEHYQAQESFKDAEGKNKRTDFVIKLPDGKHIIIDSKLNLPDYERAVSATTEEEANIALKAHVNAVKRHIDDLASKDYTDLIGINSPSFVLMFMPIEPAYIEALKHDKDLFNYGYQKGIILVSHTTLIPILRTVSNLWMLDQSNREARELGDKAVDIYNAVCLVTERMNKLGGSLRTAGNHYNDVVTSLVGQQGLHGKVERFSQLSSKVKKQMVELEPIHLEGEDQRLVLEAKPLTDNDIAEL